MNMIDQNLSYQQHDIRISKMGYEFDLYSSSWRLDNTNVINWSQIDELGLENSTVNGMRKALAVFASELSAHYTINCFNWFKKILETSETTTLTVAAIQNYLGGLDKENEYKLGAVKAFILDWHEKGFTGVSDEVAKYLSQLKLRGNLKGKAVSKGCPHSGAYNMLEQQAILEWAVNAFEELTLSLEEYCWLLANMYLGSRSIELRNITRGDLVSLKSPDNIESYKLKKVLAKKRNASFREIAEEIEIDEDLALLLLNQANSSIKYIEHHFKEGLPKEVIDKMPIFIEKVALGNLKTLSELLAVSEKMPDYIFINGQTSKNMMSKISQKCQARTVRLNGEFIHLTSRRFRYTIATNARRRGLNQYQIAKILGHTDIQNVKVYVENTNEVVDLIDESMSSVLAPLAQAFAGTLIDSEKDAIRANDPRSRIKSSSGSSLGNCGEFGFCASGGRQCYTCAKFQPWIHGQHEKVLQSVLDERNSLRDRGASVFVIQSTDRVVLAITQVIQLCIKAKGNEVPI